jgi:hypothetical protein
MYIILTTAVLERVSRQAKELLVGTLLELLMMMMMILTAVEVDVNMSISFSFVQIRTFDSDFGLEIRILTPSRVELIGKRSIFGLDTTTNR